MHQILLNELSKYFGSKSVRKTYFTVVVILVLMGLFMPFEENDILVAPGLSSTMVFLSLFGVITAFLSSKVWEQDLRKGVIVNVIVTGNSRTVYFWAKVITTVVQSAVFSGVVAVVMLVLGICQTHGHISVSFDEILLGNMYSFLMVFIFVLAESTIAMAIMHLFNSFMTAFIVALTVPFLEYLIIYLLEIYLWNLKGPFLSPVAVIIHSPRVGETNVDSLKALLVPTVAVCGIYTLVFGTVTYIKCKKFEC